MNARARSAPLPDSRRPYAVEDQVATSHAGFLATAEGVALAALSVYFKDGAARWNWRLPGQSPISGHVDRRYPGDGLSRRGRIARISM